jgi:phosphoglycolate phosphatase
VTLLIFDLDGTLIDSRLDLAQAVNATRAHLSKGPLPNEQIYSFVGQGAPVLVKRAMGPDASEEDVRNGLEFFLDYYRHHALDHTLVYAGVMESLERMHQAGLKLSVLTNKPVRTSRRILEGLGIGALFFQVYGGNSFEHKKPHRIGVDTLRAEVNATPGETWMIGDSYVDVQTARNAGVASCGVTWGFQPESFREFPPDVLVDRMQDFAERFGVR